MLLHTPIHDDIPHTAVYGIDCCKENEHRSQRICLVKSIEAQTHVIEDGTHVLSAIDEMWENISGVPVTAYAL